MNKKILLTMVAGLMFCATLFSQDEQATRELRHEISFALSGGLSSLQLGNGQASLDATNGAGGSFGAAYEYRLSKKLSLATGLELALYNSKASLNNFSDRYASHDGEYAFEFRTTVSNYAETQRAMYLNVPLLVRIQYPAGGKTSFYGAGGFKFGLPLSSKYTVTQASIKNSGYYPIWSNGQRELVLDSQEFMGFGSFRLSNIKSDLDLKLACILSLEAGAKFSLGEKLALYAGAYFDYGLNDLAGDTNKRLIEYNASNPPAFVNNSLLSSRYATGNTTARLTGKIVPIAAGLKIRLGFGL